MAEFRLLGPVEVWSDGRPLDVPRQRRQVLAALLVDAGRPVTVDTLVERVWGDEPPAQARETVYVHVNKIRRLLPPGSARIVRRASGYVLVVDRRSVDLFRFRDLVSRTGDQPAESLAEAVQLWRGEPLADLPGPWAERVRVGWRQAYFDAVLAWADSEIALHRPGVVIERLTSLVAEHPLVEPLAGALVRALGAAGRTAEALRAYADARSRLVDQLGAEPGPELRDAQRQVLDEPRPSTVRPRQLPPDITGFVGRGPELIALDRVGPTPYAPRVAVVSGPAGVGKSTLAVHWAHTARPGFPDGELYVNLRGFDASGFPVDPTDALRGFVEALGVPPPAVPADRDGLIGLYRTLLAERRMIILADNARDADQVQPLIPGAAGCLVLVTSRDRLEALAVVNTAVLLDLPSFSVEESRLLLRQRLGHDRTSVEPGALDRIVDACAGLPLALAVAAGRAAARPRHSLARLADDLSAESGTLDGLAGTTAQADVRSVLSWSYRVVGAESARLFRLLSVHPGPDVDVVAAAATAGLDVERTVTLLAELTRLHLLDEGPGPRYAFHDLLRGYGVEQTSPDERRMASRRLLDFYLRTAHDAAWRLYPYRERITIVADADGPGVAFPDAEAATAWFRAERTVLANAVAHGARVGFDEHSWQLAHTLSKYYEMQGDWHDWGATLQAGLTAAERLGDTRAQSLCLLGVGSSFTRGRRFADAEAWLRRGLELCRAGNDVAALARAHHNLSNVLFCQGRMPEALEMSTRAYELYASIGDHWGRSAALNSTAVIHTEVGDYERAVENAQRGIDIAGGCANERGAAYGWNTLGYAWHLGGDDERAVPAYRRAIDLARRLNDRFLEADTLNRLGEALAPRSPADARTAWTEALRIFVELGDPVADDVRARLRS